MAYLLMTRTGKIMKTVGPLGTTIDVYENRREAEIVAEALDAVAVPIQIVKVRDK